MGNLCCLHRSKRLNISNSISTQTPSWWSNDAPTFKSSWTPSPVPARRPPATLVPWKGCRVVKNQGVEPLTYDRLDAAPPPIPPRPLATFDSQYIDMGGDCISSYTCNSLIRKN